METPSAEVIIERNARRNFWLNVLDGGIFFFGISMVSRFTVLPLFIERVSEQRWMQGLIPMIAQTGWFLPGLFIAPLIAGMPRRKPLILAITIFERLPFLALGLLILNAPDLPAMMLLGAFFLFYAMHSFSAGIAGIPWQDFIGRIIPQRRWGIFFGTQNSLGGALGVGGAAIAGFVLATQPFPQSIGILSLLCFAALVISFIFLALTVEPPMPPKPRQPIGEFLQGIIPLLRRDEGFRRYLLSRAAIATGLLGHNFLTGAALERFQIANAEVAGFTAALLASQAIANLALGALADRWGYKQVLELSAAMGVLAIVLAMIVPSAAWFLLIFAIVGAAQAGYTLSGYTLVFSFSTPDDRPTYIGVANSAVAPVAVFGPLLAGWLAEASSYNMLFGVLTLIGIAGLLMLHWRVRAPKRLEPAQGEG